MTDNQATALRYLCRYLDAKRELDYMAERLEEIRARAEKVGSALGSVSIQKYKGKNLGQETVLIQLAEASTGYTEQAAESVRIMGEVELAITELVPDPVQQKILQYKHIQGLTHEEVAEKLSYSEKHSKRLYYEGLEELGANLKRSSKKP